MAGFMWVDRHLTVKRSKYLNGQLAILAFDNSDARCCEESGTPYGMLTVNLEDTSIDDGESQYLDIYSWPGIQWVLSHVEGIDWAKPTDRNMTDGFATYPLWEFDLDKIEAM